MVTPRTASSYVSAVRKFLQNNGVGTKFMDRSQCIQNTKAGLAQLYRIQTNRTDADRERIALTIDMIQIMCMTVAPARSSHSKPFIPRRSLALP